jgi:hypothetical protein
VRLTVAVSIAVDELAKQLYVDPGDVRVILRTLTDEPIADAVSNELSAEVRMILDDSASGPCRSSEPSRHGHVARRDRSAEAGPLAARHTLHSADVAPMPLPRMSGVRYRPGSSMVQRSGCDSVGHSPAAGSPARTASPPARLPHHDRARAASRRQ